MKIREGLPTIEKQRPSVSPSAPALFPSQDARVRGVTEFRVAPAPATRNRVVATPMPRSRGENLEEGVWIDVDAPARALRRAEALARIQGREAAILRALGDGSAETPVWCEIPIQRSPADRPETGAALGVPAAEGASAAGTRRPLMARGSMADTARADNAPQPRRSPAAPLRAEARRRGLLRDVATVPTLNFRFLAVLLSGSMLAWLVIWVVLRFCQ